MTWRVILSISLQYKEYGLSITNVIGSDITSAGHYFRKAFMVAKWHNRKWIRYLIMRFGPFPISMSVAMIRFDLLLVKVSQKENWYSSRIYLSLL